MRGPGLQAALIKQVEAEAKIVEPVDDAESSVTDDVELGDLDHRRHHLTHGLEAGEGTVEARAARHTVNVSCCTARSGRMRQRESPHSSQCLMQIKNDQSICIHAAVVEPSTLSAASGARVVNEGQAIAGSSCLFW